MRKICKIGLVLILLLAMSVSLCFGATKIIRGTPEATSYVKFGSNSGPIDDLSFRYPRSMTLTYEPDGARVKHLWENNPSYPGITDTDFPLLPCRWVQVKDGKGFVMGVHVFSNQGPLVRTARGMNMQKGQAEKAGTLISYREYYQDPMARKEGMHGAMISYLDGSDIVIRCTQESNYMWITTILDFRFPQKDAEYYIPIVNEITKDFHFVNRPVGVRPY
jgi:hypothetical protein